MPPLPRPAFAIVAFALGISALVGAIVAGALGIVFTQQRGPQEWIPYALGAALAEAILSLEFGRRAGLVAPPHSLLRRAGSGLALAAILVVIAAAVVLKS